MTHPTGKPGMTEDGYRALRALAERGWAGDICPDDLESALDEIDRLRAELVSTRKAMTEAAESLATLGPTHLLPQQVHVAYWILADELAKVES